MLTTYRSLALGALVAALVALAFCGSAEAGGPKNRADRIARYYAAQRPWHGQYSYTQWGTPVALVVPPTAVMQNSWSWGVAQSEMTPIYHQFHREYPGVISGGSSENPFMTTPLWPSHTDQFGVYPIRGPW